MSPRSRPRNDERSKRTLAKPPAAVENCRTWTLVWSCGKCKEKVGVSDDKLEEGVRNGGNSVMTQPLYEERYCAFIDILGFSNLVRSIGNDTLQLNAVQKLLKTIHSPDAGFLYDRAEAGIRAQSISDAVAISANLNREGLFMLLWIIATLGERLLSEGYFLRGGVVKGRLYHDENTVFGDALLEAYRLESQIARYPRVIIPRVLVNSPDGKSVQPRFITQASDGPFFVDILWRTADDLYLAIEEKEPMPSDQMEFLSVASAKLQQRLDEAVDNPNHFEKVKWFATYWNDTLAQVRWKKNRISGTGNSHALAM